MTVLDFVILTLAAGGLVDVLRNGSIFEARRYACGVRLGLEPEDPEVEAEHNNRPQGSGRFGWLADKLCELFLCSFCLSYQAPFWLALAFWLPGVWVRWYRPDGLGDAIAASLTVPLYVFAAARLGNLVNALAPKMARYDHPAWEVPEADASLPVEEPHVATAESPSDHPADDGPADPSAA